MDDATPRPKNSRSSASFADGTAMIVTSGRERHSVRGTRAEFRQPRPNHRQADRRTMGQGQVRTGRPGALYKGKPYESHKRNFYRCLREGGLPVSDVFSHVQAMNTCHLWRLPRGWAE